MIKQTEQKNSGFSLVEIIIVISISLILFLIMSMVYYISQTTYNKTDTRAEITQNGRVILDRMIRELRQAQSVITILPADNSDPDSLPAEIKFLDGHNTSNIAYIRYYLDGQDIKREYSRYYFAGDQSTDVYIYDTDQFGNPPVAEIIEDKIIGEYASDLEFWGNNLITINLYLIKGSENINISTSIYGRNL
ncbi:MAG: prepilin-type N-terminal cleavage/methylation domain-containing protein [Candidatus Buchananbacteria bacterium]|nr:prepilin-type N-terminal cleavage/methylation domain-containing protein [Candidatus Buchananbacteria bacterium]